MVVSLLAAIIIHIILFITLGHLKLNDSWTLRDEVVTRQVVVRPVDEEFEEPLPSAPDDEEIPAPKPDQNALLDDVEILQQLKEPELDMKPNIQDASFDVAVKFENPALSGDPAGDVAQLSSALEINDSEIDALGKNATMTPSASEGQLIVDPGADVSGLDKLDDTMEEFIKKGAGGISPQGLPNGTTSLDEIAGLPSNVLVTKTTMLPSDLLFEFNSDQLRSSAKVGMQKIALVMDLNPDLYCWIDGHTDLIGSESANVELSRRRAQAVKTYLVGIGMAAEKIITRGYGKSRPIILSGDQDQQAANRRVELKLRKTPPSEDDVEPAPLKANAVIQKVIQPALPQPANNSPMVTPDSPQRVPQEAPPQAIRVKPMRALPVVEDEIAPPAQVMREMPRAPSNDDPAIESGVVEEHQPPRAAPVRE